jgi:SAM-dependent methyltransferase
MGQKVTGTLEFPMNSYPGMFRVGMKYQLASLKAPVAYDMDPEKDINYGSRLPVLNLGSGVQEIQGCDNLDYPDWDAEEYTLPYEDESVGGIYALHFLEHLTDPRRMIQECARVLIKDAPLNVCVPWWGASMAHHDLDHKTTWSVDTFRNLLDNRWYTKGKGWGLRLNESWIMGVAERNLAVFAQLIKEDS